MDLQAKPGLTDIARQITQNDQQGKVVGQRTAGMYQGLAGVERQSVAAQQTNSDTLNRTLAGIGQNTQSQIGQAAQAAQAALAPSAAKGLDGGAAQQLAQIQQQQAGNAAQGSQVFQSAGAVQGANYSGLAASQLGSSAMRGKERLGDVAAQFGKNRGDLVNTQAGLQAKRNELLATTVNQIRGSEFNKIATSQTLNLHNAQFAAGERDKAAQRAVTLKVANQNHVDRVSAQNLQRNLGLLNHQDRVNALHYQDHIARLRARLHANQPLSASERLAIQRDNAQQHNHTGPYAPQGHGRGRGRSGLPAGQNSAFDQIDRALHFFHLNGNDKWQQTRDGLIRGSKGYPRIAPELVNAAASLAVHGGLGPGEVHQLHQRGYHIGNRYHVLPRPNGNVVPFIPGLKF